MMMNKRLSQGKERTGEILNNLPNLLTEWVCTAVSILELLCSVRFHCLIIDQILMTKDLKERYLYLLVCKEKSMLCLQTTLHEREQTVGTSLVQPSQGQAAQTVLQLMKGSLISKIIKLPLVL